MRPIGLIGVVWTFAAVVSATAATISEPDPLQLALVAPPDDNHFSHAAGRQLQQNAAEDRLELVVKMASVTEANSDLPDLLLMPVRSLATQVPELQVLELPFLFPSIEAVHAAVEGDLGVLLRQKARARGWEILAWWDEGMHVLSGLKRYDRVTNLKIREFLITRPDPVAEKQFKYWRAHPRRIDLQDREAVLRECLIASRAATLQRIVSEELFRVHLAVSLSNHRYEGWVVVAPRDRLDKQTMQKLQIALDRTTAWQRADARHREAAALADLQRVGTEIYEVDETERAEFRARLPDLAELLPDSLDAQTRQALVTLASAGTAAVAGTVRDGAAAPPGRGAAPGTDDREDDKAER